MVWANQHVQYVLPNVHTWVGRLLKSITSKDPAIVSAITHIEGNPGQRDNFEQAANFLLLRAPSTSNNDNTRRIISVKNKNKGSGKHKVGEKTGVELRYYTMKEYNKLSHEEKKELASLQKDRNKENAGNDQTISALKQQVEELEARLVAAINTKDELAEPAKSDPLKNPLTQRNWMIPPSSNEGSGGERQEISARFSQYLVQKIAAVDIKSDTEVSALELNSHTDSPVVGKHAKIIIQDKKAKFQDSPTNLEMPYQLWSLMQPWFMTASSLDPPT